MRVKDSCKKTNKNSPKQKRTNVSYRNLTQTSSGHDSKSFANVRYNVLFGVEYK